MTHLPVASDRSPTLRVQCAFEARLARRDFRAPNAVRARRQAKGGAQVAASRRSATVGNAGLLIHEIRRPPCGPDTRIP
jgi:hypothetical protein